MPNYAAIRNKSVILVMTL